MYAESSVGLSFRISYKKKKGIKVYLFFSID